MSATCWLVKLNTLSFIEPIREGVRKNSLMYKFVMNYFQRLIIIGLTNEERKQKRKQSKCV